ncbi:hypothetical protein BDR22DRAFT_802538 [Usnea florida]
MENGASSGSSDPSSFLTEIIGAPVRVKLNSSVEYRGYLMSVDGYMNISLEKTEEYVDGKMRRSYGEAFVRGNNGILHYLRNPTERVFANSRAVLYISAS